MLKIRDERESFFLTSDKKKMLPEVLKLKMDAQSNWGLQYSLVFECLLKDIVQSREIL